jgi:hypothetical protein
VGDVVVALVVPAVPVVLGDLAAEDVDATTEAEALEPVVLLVASGDGLGTVSPGTADTAFVAGAAGAAFFSVTVLPG